MAIDWTPIVTAGGAALALGGIGGATTPIGQWYADLRKPSFQPPNWAFGPAWSVILTCAASAAVVAWNAADTPAERADILILYAVNALFFLLWSPLFFVAKRPDWARIEVVFLWGSVLALAIGLRPISPTASWLVAPYLAWVSFAAVLNHAIVRLNAPFAR
ncbi:TspO/MBR family protein [Sphingomonas japonica]|uniref:Tryptophan-rich sensory protein n=1 Tax=Sphingomonas japonica TaxID=511662 RepID=A0ABX0U3V7_9SPHN|nr:TspO/MBR family protein [Sphingomonas japonica]NIJ24439.1 tryptophan-rich sensory protein [Sphingomonas japonica]